MVMQQRGACRQRLIVALVATITILAMVSGCPDGSLLDLVDNGSPDNGSNGNQDPGPTTYAFVAIGGAGLAIIDVTEPTNPGQPVTRNMAGYAQSVTVSDGYAFVALDSAGLGIVDVSNPSLPGEPSYWSSDSYSTDVAVAGAFAYVADGSDGLAVIDVSDPHSPSLLRYVVTGSNAVGVTVIGNLAYVASQAKPLGCLWSISQSQMKLSS